MVSNDETIQTKPIRQQFSVVLFIMLYKVVLDLQSYINHYDHSNEIYNYRAALCHGFP